MRKRDDPIEGAEAEAIRAGAAAAEMACRRIQELVTAGEQTRFAREVVAVQLRGLWHWTSDELDRLYPKAGAGGAKDGVIAPAWVLGGMGREIRSPTS